MTPQTVPSFSIHASSEALLKREEGTGFANDYEYIEALRGIESLRRTLLDIRQSLRQGGTIVVGNSIVSNLVFPEDEGEPYERGVALELKLRTLLIQLEEKRDRMLEKSSRRPIMEAFLDKMEATDFYRRVIQLLVFYT